MTHNQEKLIENYLRSKVKSILKEENESIGGYGKEGLKKIIDYSKKNPSKEYTFWAISSFKDRYFIRNGKIRGFDDQTPTIKAKEDYQYKLILK